VPQIETWIAELGISAETARITSLSLNVLLLAAVAALTNWAARRLIIRVIAALVERTPNGWDDRLMQHGVFRRLSHVVPAMILQALAPRLLVGDDAWIGAATVAINAYLVIIALLVIDAALSALLAFLEEREVASRIPVKSFIQAMKLIIFLVGFLLLLSVLFDRNPLYFFSGLGALTAILLLVFKDSILGLVAGVQLSVNNMIKKGDWIEMPKHGADGDVIDVTLTTIKVQNWDQTITTIPTYSLISEAFKNWRGMSESGGRRIKRALRVDLDTVRFADDALIERLRRIQLLRPYLDQRLPEIAAWNAERAVDPSEPVNGRRMTNLGCFRAYCDAYLRNHERIHKQMTFLVRHLEPTDTGIPIELYVFVNDTRWAIYEGVQADIFDHLIAALPHFGLRLFQSPSGRDIAALAALAAPSAPRSGSPAPAEAGA